MAQTKNIAIMLDNDADKKCSIHKIFITKVDSWLSVSNLCIRIAQPWVQMWQLMDALSPPIRDYWWHSYILRTKPTIVKFYYLELRYRWSISGLHSKAMSLHLILAWIICNFCTSTTNKIKLNFSTALSSCTIWSTSMCHVSLANCIFELLDN